MRPQIGRHYDHGIAEIDGAALAIRHPAIVENLKQHVEHVGVRFLDLIQQDHAVGLTSNRFGQVAPFFVTDISRWRTDETGNRVFLHELAHVDPDHAVFAVKQEPGQGLAKLGLADPGWAQKKERSVGTTWVG